MKLVKSRQVKTGPLDPEEYVRRAFRIGNEARAAQERYGKMLDALDNQYVIERCPRHNGEVIELPEGAKPGFDTFTIDRIRPHIQRSGDTAYAVGFRYFGTFTGPDGATEKGELKIKAKQLTNETNEKPADA